MQFIDLKSQYADLKSDVDAAIQGVLDHGQYIMGPEVAAMEQALCDYTGAPHCISVASGTEALLISMMALGIGAGDEVITTPFTFAATAETIALLGATPVFADIHPDTCNIDPEAIAPLITDRTRAIIPVSLYGQPADMDEINSIGEPHGLPVIDDAAQSFGAEYRGRGNETRRIGNLAPITCTSFFPSKPLGCYGDGGAIFAHDPDIAQACREIRVHGQSKRYTHTRIGVGGRMDTLQCAVVLAKLKRFDWEVERRLAIGARYNRLLDDAGIARVQQRPDRTSVFGQYSVFVDDRAGVQERLKAAGVPTAVHYPIPLNRQPAYAGRCGGGETPRADAAAARVMSLPMHPYLEDAQQDAIVAALVEAVKAR